MKTCFRILFGVALALGGLSRAGAQVPTDGLTLWLKGDTGVTLNGQTVAVWADQSGQGHDATQTNAPNQPLLIQSGLGKPAVRFDGATDFLNFSVPINYLDSLSIILVANNTSAAQNGGSAYSDCPAIFWNETASWGWVFLGVFQTNVNWRFGTTTSGNNCRYARPASIGSAHTLTTLIKNADVETLYVDRAEALRLEYKNYPLAGVADNGYLGRGSSTYFAGEILEVLVYTRALSEADRQAVETYLHGKYLANQRPTVTITSPAELASFNAPAAITVTADVTDDGAIAQVEFFANGVSIGTDTTAPYSVTWNDVPGGAYGLTAKATDTEGAWTVSDRVVIHVSYASPVEGPVLNGLGLWYRADAGVTTEDGGVSVWADQSGFERHAVQPIASARPRPVTGGNGKPAVAFDGVRHYLTFAMPMNGLSGLTLVAVANNTSPQTTGAAGEGCAVLYWNESAGWGGMNLGVFQDSATWRIGTTASQSGSPNYPGPAHTRPASLVRNYSRTVVVKDGATEMLYTNGVQALSVGGKGATTAGIDGNRGNLGRGFFSSYYTYLRGEIQEVLLYTNALSSAELADLDTYLRAKYWAKAQPEVAITTPADNTDVVVPADLTVTADAADADGSVAQVEFFDGATLIGTATQPPWSVPWNNVGAGAHMVTAKVTDNEGLFNFSAPVFVFGRAASGFTLVENFENRELAPLLFQGEWSGAFPDDQVRLDPTTFEGGNPSNKVLRLAKANQTLSFPALIPEGETRTLFFRAASTTWSRDDVRFGFADKPAFGYAEEDDFEVEGRRYTGNSLANPYLAVRDGGTMRTNSQAFRSDVWYKLWMVVNNATDTWKMYIQGGEYDNLTPLDWDGKTTFEFYHGPAGNPLIRLYIRAIMQSVSNGANGGFWMDDFYLAVGEDLSDPTAPPPPTLMITRAGENVLVAWPATAVGYNLESCDNLTAPTWSAVGETPVQVGDQMTVTLPLTGTSRYLRLKK